MIRATVQPEVDELGVGIGLSDNLTGSFDPRFGLMQDNVSSLA
jgi:hypothetical protein